MGAVTSGLSLPTLRRGEWWLLLSSAGVVAAVAWLLLVRSSYTSGHGVLLGPHVHAASLTTFLLVALMWLTMMVAMMLPPVLPWIVGFAAVARPAGTPGARSAAVAVFSGGYFTVWVAYSIGGALLQMGLQHGGLLGVDLQVSTVMGGMLLLGAGLYEISPLKEACLAYCRSPLSFFLERWEDGPVGAFRMGFRHGLYCLGCCWALMALSFALGVMNLLWMAALTLVLCVEKIAPGGERLSRALGLLLMAWGALVLLTSGGLLPWM